MQLGLDVTFVQVCTGKEDKNTFRLIPSRIRNIYDHKTVNIEAELMLNYSY